MHIAYLGLTRTHTVNHIMNFYKELENQKGHTGPDYSRSQFNEGKLLLVGAGGIGCEVLKDLIFMGVHNIDVIDMDKIDLSNLNRQFLFSEEDIGEYKSEVAIRRMKELIRNRTDYGAFLLNSMTSRIQDVSLSQLSEYMCVITALDNVEARRWVNSALFDLLEFDDNGDLDVESVVFLVDGGSEGLLGQARFIAPGLPIACYECTLYLTQGDTKAGIPLCTLAFTPRNGEHCIEYARVAEWPKDRGDEVFDPDDPEHSTWIFERALSRAKAHGIALFDEFYCIGVLKRIIPSVASTNALVGAFMANLVLRLVIAHNTNFDASVGKTDNYLAIAGDTSYLAPVSIFPDPNCEVCGLNSRENKNSDIKVQIENFEITLQELLIIFKNHDKINADEPSIIRVIPSNDRGQYERETIYISNKSISGQFSPNLTKSLATLGFSQASNSILLNGRQLRRSLHIQLCSTDH
eukprot:GHVH01012044.1.p1 GENE.GHVH01012044.1~~GHVH01012044.1.p1  ORF type:complete len:465 (-),score=52.43 GHVH01012044.1:1076-2470(-)